MSSADRLGSNELVRLLAEPTRRRVVAALILQPAGLLQVAETTGLGLREVTAALARLETAGLVAGGDDGTYVVLEATFERAARAEAHPPPPSEHGDEPPEIAQVLDRAFREGRLVHLPAKRSKRLLVLDRLAQEFEPGVRYSEKQVNATLVAFDPDVATLRRYLVDEGFLDRGGGLYWRSGGTV